jgi:hypothetical protein
MRGGPRKGAGHPRKCPDTVRDCIVRISMTDSELAALESLAEQWDVPVATAAYGLFADQIARCRNSKPLAMPEKLIYAASRIVAKYPAELKKEAI